MHREAHPFAPLNLRWNPFSEPPDRERAPLAVVDDVDLEGLAARLSTPGLAVQITGDAGRGKSTLLRAIHARFATLPLTYVADGESPRVPRASVVFIDEAQRLAPRVRARIFGRRSSFAITTHVDLADELRARGLEVRSFARGGLDLERLRRVVSRRTEWARRGPGALPRVDDATLEALLAAHGDDLRAIGDALYFWFQREKDEGHGFVPARARG